jgi:hypothetical protein
MSDRTQELVTLAHTFFNETLTSTVIDMDRESAISFLNECYNFPCPVRIEKIWLWLGS